MTGLGTPTHVIGHSIAGTADAPLRPSACYSLNAMIQELARGGVPAGLAHGRLARERLSLRG